MITYTYFLIISFIGSRDEACGDDSLAKVLRFCTGSKYPPRLGFDNPITVCFDPNTDWPLASTCVFKMILLTNFNNNFENCRDNVNHGGFVLL